MALATAAICDEGKPKEAEPPRALWSPAPHGGSAEGIGGDQSTLLVLAATAVALQEPPVLPASARFACCLADVRGVLLELLLDGAPARVMAFAKAAPAAEAAPSAGDPAPAAYCAQTARGPVGTSKRRLVRPSLPWIL
jgi:hypothetical protein